MRTIGLLFLAIGLSQPVVAEPTVIYPGDNPAMAAARVAATTKLDATSIKPVTLPDVTEFQTPVLYGSGSADTCDGPSSTMKALRGAVDRAESGVAYMEYEAASAHLRLAQTALKCLGEPIHPETGSRLFFLSGILLHANGKLEAAGEAYKKAHLYKPGLIWDDYFPPDSKELFDATAVALESTAKLTLSIVPTPPEGALWVNGSSIATPSGTFTLREGQHLVQVVGAKTTTIELALQTPEANSAVEAPPEEGSAAVEAPAEEGSAAVEAPAEATASATTHTLVIPSAVTSNDLSWVNEDASRETLETVLNAALSEGGTVYIPMGNSVWTTVLGSGEWTRLEVPARALGPSVNPRLLTGQLAFWGGTALVLGGGGVSGVKYFQAQNAVTDGRTASNTTDFESADLAYQSARETKQITDIVFYSGVFLVGGGWLLQRDVSLAPWSIHEGRGLAVTLSR